MSRRHGVALIIVTMVVLGVTINFWQSYRSQQAADRLRTSVNPTATVRRDGAWVEIPLRNVVPGDVFQLSAGDANVTALAPAARCARTKGRDVSVGRLDQPGVRMATVVAGEASEVVDRGDRALRVDREDGAEPEAT